MNAGGNVYIEGSNFGADHSTTQFFDYFGCSYDSDYTNNVQEITGVDGSIISGMTFDFSDGSDENYSVDEISKDHGNDLLYSTGDYMRGVYYENSSGYRTIATTAVLGGFIDGLFYTRAGLIANYLDFLLGGFNSTEDEPEYNTTSLMPNYPNPFNSSTKIDFYIKESGKTKLSIYNIKGEKIKIILSDNLEAGEHTVQWDGKNSANKDVNNGIYFYKLESNGFSHIKKMVLSK